MATNRAMPSAEVTALLQEVGRRQDRRAQPFHRLRLLGPVVGYRKYCYPGFSVGCEAAWGYVEVQGRV